MAVTLQDVGRRAGVSAMTVSRVINGRAGVDAATQRKVEAAIAELDYTPNRIARGLLSQKTETIGLIVPDVVNPFFAPVVRGAETAARRAGYRVLLCNSEGDLRLEREYIEDLVAHPVGDYLAVVEHGLTIHHGLHFTGGTTDGAQEDVLCFVVVGCPTVGPGTVGRMVPGTDQETVADNNPPGRSAPTCLQDHRAWQVADVGGYVDVDRRDAEHAGVSTKYPSEHAWRVKARNAHPFHRTVGRNEGRHLSIA